MKIELRQAEPQDIPISELKPGQWAVITEWPSIEYVGKIVMVPREGRSDGKSLVRLEYYFCDTDYRWSHREFTQGRCRPLQPGEQIVITL